MTEREAYSNDVCLIGFVILKYPANTHFWVPRNI